MYRKIIHRSIGSLRCSSGRVLFLNPKRSSMLSRNFEKRFVFKSPYIDVFRLYRKKKNRHLSDIYKDYIYDPGDKAENYVPTAEVDREQFVEEFQVAETTATVLEIEDHEILEEEYRQFYEVVNEEHKKDRKIVYYLVIINVAVFLLFNIRYFFTYLFRYSRSVDEEAEKLGIKTDDVESLSTKQKSQLEEIKKKVAETEINEYYGPRIRNLFHNWGMSVSNVCRKPWTMLSSNFIHAGTGHLAGNMLFLMIFGRRLRGRLRGMTWKRFAALYIGGGLGGSACSLIHKEYLYRKTGDEEYRLLPSVGASGSVYTIMAANMLYTFRTNSFVLQFYLYRLAIFEIIKFVSQSREAGKKGGQGGQKVDHGAHIGGMIFSALFFLMDILDFF